MEKNLTTETSNGGRLKVKRQKAKGKKGTSFFTFYFLLFTFFCVSAVNLSCSSKPTDLRTLVPADSLVYLETNDLGAALQPIVDNKAFEQVAKSKPDLSSLKGVQLAVAVIGFETREEKLTDEHSIGRIQPHFVAIADTHSWNYQAVGFAEQKLGAFVANVYDSEPTLEKADKNGGKYFTWTAKDGRKAYALVIDAVIYFGNDESAIDKCLAVKRGEAESLVKNGKVPPADPKTLASGYVGPDGIAQIANIVSLKFASEAGEDSEVQSAIAGILPQLLRNSITEISWTATKTDNGFEDKFVVSMPPDVARVLSETMAPSDVVDTSLLLFSPPDATSITQYNFNHPQIAWRSVLLTAQKLTDPVSGRLLGALSNSLFEPYGIRNGELFLGLIATNIVTVRYDDAEDVVVIWQAKDDWQEKKKQEQAFDPDFLRTIGNRFEASGPGFHNVSVSGHPDIVLKCGLSQQNGQNLKSDERFSDQPQNIPSIRTVGRDSDSATVVASVLSDVNFEAGVSASRYLIETRFTKNGMERKTVSDFGLIGSIIAQLAAD